MSCELRPIAQLLDINKCKILFTEKGDQKNENWLQECVVSLSPTSEILVMAKGTQLVVFTLKWSSKESDDIKMRYNVLWEGIPCSKSGDITSVLCLPLLSHRQCSSGIDWTCIVVGFSSGSTKFFTEDMQLLVSELLHAEPVTRIKCNSLKTQKQRGTGSATDQELNESIYVLYKSVMCVINGFSLFQTLRGCRSRLGRQNALLSVASIDTSLPMDFKKYGFVNQDAITDSCFIGQTTVNVFDHFVTASLRGFDCSYRPSPPQTSLIVATGRKPFLSFHYTIEGGSGAVLADVALAVASKIKESVAATLPGWFGFSSTEQEKPKASQEPAEQLFCRFGLCDLWRHGNFIVTSPDNRFSAVTDSLGRIILIENSTGIARRLWKGYREAQCGFIEVEEDLDKSKHKKTKGRSSSSTAAPNPRRVLFIVIYAPKRGLIEVFGVQQGPCVALFKVSRHGQLIYTPYGMLGFTSAPSKGVNASQYPVVFMSEDGISEIHVPFHCGLRSDNSNKARDLHILKRIKSLLKEDRSDESKFNDEMKGFAKDLKTDEIKMQVIEMLMTNKRVTVEAFMTVLNVFIEGFKDAEANQSESFIFFVESLEKLLSFYVFLIDLNNQPPNYKILAESDETGLSETLLLTGKEMSSILKLINTVREMETKNRKQSSRVTFSERGNKSLTQFLACFDFNALVGSGCQAKDTDDVYLTLKPDLSEDKFCWVSRMLFSGIFYSDDCINDWKTYVSESRLDRTCVMKCLMSYWLSKDVADNLTYEVTTLVELITAICSLFDPGAISVEYNKPSPWWKTIQNYLKSRPCTVNSLLAAVACRTVTITVEQVKEMSLTQSGKKVAQDRDGDTSQSNEWENVSHDTWDWDILIGSLEDVTLLNSILSLGFNNPDSTRPKLNFDSDDLSLADIFAKGNGYVSELVARWLARFGLEPACIVDKSDVEFQVRKSPESKKSSEPEIGVKTESMDIEEANVIKENDAVAMILDYLNTLKQRFPYSLTSSSLLINMCWEYLASWYKNTDDLSYMEMSIDYLMTVPSVSLKHGLSYLCWKTYVADIFSSVAKLISKLGKVPKDKFCVQEVNLTSIQVPVFLKLSTNLLTLMLETSFAERDKFIANEEGLWQTDPVAKIPSLVTLALSQPKVNDKILELHCQLSMALCMVSQLNVKGPKLFSSLFDNEALTLLFTDLTKKSQISSHSSNTLLTNSRKQFLYKVIAGAVQTIEVVESIPQFPVAETEDYMPKTRTSVDKATKWLSDVFILASMWDVPLDDLKRRHVCELYSCGFDRLAEEILPSVNETSMLASQLLLIAGGRLKMYISGSFNVTEKWSHLSPNLTTWLHNLDCDTLRSHTVDLSDLQNMLSNILACCPKKAEEMLALEMAEAIPSLGKDTD